MRRLHLLGVLTLLVAVWSFGGPDLRGASRRYFDDDPLAVEPDPHDASSVEPSRVGYAWDMYDNLFGEPGDKAENVRARDLNSVDEVPDSSWFTNRIGTRPMTAAELARGNDTQGPAPGPWTIVSAKSDGQTPGFVVEDTARQRWFIKFDAPGNRGMATGAEVLVNKIMWALGYHVPEYYIAHFRREDLVLAPDARIEPPGYNERRMKVRDIDVLLELVDREREGLFHVSASKALPGTPVGRFRFHGTRPDDPNDVVPHEHRRGLRALRVFSAWVNHVEMRAGNTLDTLVQADGKAKIRHHLLDFGSTLGSAGLKKRPYWEGQAYMYEGGQVAKSALTLGLAIPSWRKMAFYESPAVGRMPALEEPFDPEAWKPGIPNAAFLRARADDKFWAARRVMAFTDEMIRAVVKAAEYYDPRDEEFIASTLIKRRDAIGRAYLAGVNPVVDPSLAADGTLSFANAAVDAGVAAAPTGYTAAWFAFDNATAEATPIGQPTSHGNGNGLRATAALPAAAGSLVRVDISAQDTAHASWARPARAFFRRQVDGSWKLVGLERTPDGP
jgi:hypothetical protein